VIVDSTAPAAIVIPVHNGWSYTERALQAIRDGRGGRVAVVVVDDGSSDGTTGLLQAKAPDVTVVPGSGALWWSGAANAGCRHAIAEGAETLVLFNNDNYGISDACFATLFKLVAETGGCVSPVVLEDWEGRRRLRHAGGALDWRRGGIRLRAVGSPYSKSDRIVDCDWLPGSALAFPAGLFIELDGFDERRFPQYRGDIDFTLRARRLGRRCVVTYACNVVNDRSQGGLGFDGRIGPRRFVLGLVSLKSNYNVREAVPFALRHCPPGLLPRYLVSFYSRYAYAALKTWLPHRVRTRLDLAGQRRRAALE
jgi:GT2 family glycosyltransferase